MTSGDADAVAQSSRAPCGSEGALDEPMAGGSFDQQALLIAAARTNRAVVDALLDAGADVNVRSRWWAGGFGVLDVAEPGTRSLSHRAWRGGRRQRGCEAGHAGGARPAPHARPALVHARGGDGQTPLHVASTVAIAQLLLDRGATSMRATSITSRHRRSIWSVIIRTSCAFSSPAVATPTS